MRDREDGRGVLAFGAEGLREAGLAQQGGLAAGRRLGVVGTRALLSVRRVRNGWVLDDGRGTELVALTAAEVGAFVIDWCGSVEEADGGGEGGG